MKGGFNA